MVHDVASRAASEVVNGGDQAMLAYLLEHGFTVATILADLGD